MPKTTDKPVRRKQGIVSKIMNAGLIAFGFSRVLTILFFNLSNIPRAVSQITSEATFGLSEGRLDLEGGAKMYAPVAGAATLGYLKSYLLRKFPVRR